MELIEFVIGVVVVALAIGAAASLAVAVVYLSGRIALRNRAPAPEQERSGRSRAMGG